MPAINPTSQSKPPVASDLQLQFIDGQLAWFAAIEKTQLFAKLNHPGPDSRPYGAERQAGSAGNFAVGKTRKEGHLDHVPLFGRQMR